MPITPSYIQDLNKYLRAEMGADADKLRLDLYQGRDGQGNPLGTFDTYHGIRGTISHNPSGDPMASVGTNPLYEFTLRHDEDSHSFFVNGTRVMPGSGGNTQDTLKLLANKMAMGFRQSVTQGLDANGARDVFNRMMQAHMGSYLDPRSAMTPGASAKINSEVYFGTNFNPTTFEADSGPFQINGQHYFSRTMKMQGPSIEGLYPSLEGSMWTRDDNGNIMFANTKADTHVDQFGQLIVDNQNATKFVKHAQKRGTGDIGRLFDPLTGRELNSAETHGYRTDPMTGRIIRDQGYDLNYFIPVGGGELNMGQVAQYRQLDFQIDRTATVNGPYGSAGSIYGMLPDYVAGRYQDIPGMGRTTGQWDRADIMRDRMQTVSTPLGDTAYIPITMTIAAAGNTAQGHSGIKGYNVSAVPGAYGAPAGMDFGIAANSIKDGIAWANANISGNMDYLLAQGKSLKEAASMLGLSSIYNTDASRGQLGYDQSNMSNYDTIRMAYQNTIAAPWNQAPGGIIARVNTNIGRFGAWQWGKPGLPAEDMPKLSSMDVGYYNRVNAYSSSRQDPYAEIVNSGVAMSHPGQSGFVARPGVQFEDIMGTVSGYGSKFAGKMNVAQLTESLGGALGAEGLSETSPILVEAKIRAKDGTLSPATLRLPSYRNLVWGSGQKMSMSGYDENGAPDDMKSEGITNRVSEYTNLASRIMHQRMYDGEVNIDDATRYMQMSDKLSYSEGILRHAQQMYLPSSSGGPVFGDKSIARNQVALGDRQISKMFGISETDSEAGLKLAQAKALLNGGGQSAYYTLYPHLSQNKLLRLEAISMDSIKGMSVDNMPYGIGVHPMTQSQLDKDTDVDAALVALSSRYQWDAGSKRFVVSEAGAGPMSVSELDRRMREMKRTGQGDAEWNKWFGPDGDMSKYDTLDKLKAYLSNRMPEHVAMISSADIQSQGYVKEAEYGWQMGWFYNQARKSLGISGFNEMSARIWEPYYQAALDKTPLSEQAGMGYQILKSLQPATAGFKGGEDYEGNPILGSYRLGRSSGIGMPGLNKAMGDIITNMWTAPEIADKHLLMQMLSGVDADRAQSALRILGQGLPNSQRMAAGKLLSSMAWDNAAQIGGPGVAIRSDISRRWRQKNVAGFLMGNAPGPEDLIYGDLGDAAGSLVDIMSARFDTQEEMVAAFQNALVQTEPGSRGGIPFGNYMGGVYERLGFMNNTRGHLTPGFRALEGFSKSLGFDVLGNAPEKYTNLSIGPGVYQDARIQPEEARLLRGLESIGRTNPDKAKEISEWLGSHAQPGSSGGLHIYTNPAITMDPDKQKMMEMLHDAIRLGVNAQSQMADERIKNIYNMPSNQSDVVMQAISNVTQGKYVNPAQFVQASGLEPQNEIFDAIMRVQGGMQQGVNRNQIGTFHAAATQLASFSLHQSERLSNQNFRNSMSNTAAARLQGNADGSYENLAALLGVSGSGTPEQLKTGLHYAGGGYAFGGARSSTPIDPRQLDLTTRAFEGLGETMKQLEPLTQKLATAHGDLAKQLQDQIKPLEAVKDKFLSSIRGANQMEATAESMSGGDTGRKEMLMRALGANNMMSISQTETDLASITPRAARSGIGGMWDSITGGLSDLSQGKGALSKFLRNGQFMNGIELFALNRLDKAFTQQAIGGTLASAQLDAGYSNELSVSGYAASPSSNMRAAGIYAALQNSFQRQEGATWSSAVGGISGALSGSAGGAASIMGGSLAAAALGGFAGFTLGGPIGGVIGAGLAGTSTFATGLISRQQYLANNPAFAATDAYNTLVTANGGWVPTTKDANGNTVVDNSLLPGYNSLQTSMAGGLGSNLFMGKPVDGPARPILGPAASTLSGADAGANFNYIARMGAPRSMMDRLDSAGRLEVANNIAQDLSGKGWNPALAMRAFQQNQNYFGGGNANMGALLNMGMSGVDIDAATQLMSGLYGGSAANYGAQVLPYQNNPMGFQTAMAGLQSPFAGALAGMGYQTTLQGGEMFRNLPVVQQGLATNVASQLLGVFNQATQRGLNMPGNDAQVVADLDAAIRTGDPNKIAAAKNRVVSMAQRGATGASAYDSMLSWGATDTQAISVGNGLIGASPASFGAAQGLASQMVGLGVSPMDAGSMMSQATGAGVGFSRVMGNALSGNPDAMSFMGQVAGDSRMITKETGAWGGNAGLPLFTSTLGYGNRSPIQAYNRMFTGLGLSAGVQNALVNGGPNLTGQSYGGQWGAQDYFAQQGWNLQLGAIGIQAGNVQRDIAFTEGKGIGAYTNMFTGQPFTQGMWALEDQQISQQRAQQAGMLGFEGASINLRGQQFAETQAFNRSARTKQYQWQQEDMAFQHSTDLLQRGWTAQDWTYNKSVSARDYGWQQEDFNVEIRRSQGFQRRQLIKEKERSTEAYDTSLQHENTAEHRQQQMWHLEDQQFDKQKKRAAEVFDIDMRRMDMEKKQFLEQQALDLARHAAQVGWMQEAQKTEDEMRQLQRTQWDLGKKSELASLGNQAAGVKLSEAQYKVDQAISREQDKQRSALGYRMQTETDFYNSIADWFVKMKDYLQGGASGAAPHLTPPPMSGPGPGHPGVQESNGAAVGYQGLQRNEIVVGEFGPERLSIKNGWQQVTPSLPAFDSNFHGGKSAGGGDVYVILDGDLIAAKMITRNAKKIYRDRKR